MLRILMMSLFLIIPALPALAQSSCGEPLSTNLDTNPGVQYCNIYNRQLAYGEEAIKFRRQLEERRKKYVAPGHEIQHEYKEGLKKTYDNRTSSSNRGPASDSYGPGINQ